MFEIIKEKKVEFTAILTIVLLLIFYGAYSLNGSNYISGRTSALPSANNGDVLQYNSGNWSGAATSSLGIVGGGGSGTVTNVGMITPTGLEVSGTPITTAGTATIALASGYNIPLTASTTAWENKISSQWTTSGSNLYYEGGGISVGTTAPPTANGVYAIGPIQADGGLYATGGVFTAETLNGQASYAKSEVGPGTTGLVTNKSGSSLLINGTWATTPGIPLTSNLITGISIKPQTITIASGTLQNSASLFIESASTPTITGGTQSGNNYAMWIASSTSNSRIDGKLSVGTTSPSFQLDVYGSLNVATSTSNPLLRVLPSTNQIIIGTTTSDSFFSIWGTSVYSELIEIYSTLGSVLFKVTNSAVSFLTDTFSSAINFGGDINIQGTSRRIDFGTATGTASGVIGWQATSTDIFSVYPAPANMATATQMMVSNYEPLSFPVGSQGAYAAQYSDDVTRILAPMTANGGTMYLYHSQLCVAGATCSYAYVRTASQAITASTLYITNSAMKGAVTTEGYHYVMVGSTTNWYIKRATSSWDTDISLLASWATSTISGITLNSSMLGIVGVASSSLWVASNTTVLIPYAISTSTNTLTSGSPVTITGAGMTLLNTKVNQNGIYAGFGSAPYFRKYNFSGVNDSIYGGGHSPNNVGSNGFGVFAMKNSYYIYNPAAVLQKVIGW